MRLADWYAEMVQGRQILMFMIANTIGRLLIAWFNDCILGKSGKIANPIIVMVNPVLYYSIRARLCL